MMTNQPHMCILVLSTEQEMSAGCNARRMGHEARVSTLSARHHRVNIVIMILLAC